jgi:alpha-1,3-rhamnosyl/mannosyltransferase
MPEVAGDAAIYIDPLDIESIAYGMQKLANDSELRNKLSYMGPNRAALFSWEKTAREMLIIYEKAAEIRGIPKNPR